MIRRLEWGTPMARLFDALKDRRSVSIRQAETVAEIPQPRTPDPTPAPDLPKPREGGK